MRTFSLVCFFMLLFSVNSAFAEQSYITAEIKSSRNCKDPYMWIWIDGKQIEGNKVRVSEPVSPGSHEVSIQGYCDDGKGGSKSLGSKAKRVNVKPGKVERISFQF